jgi:hypothetical protein
MLSPHGWSRIYLPHRLASYDIYILQKHLSPRQALWMLFLEQFPMIEHIPGETNVIADLLSGIPEYSERLLWDCAT